MNLYHAEQMAIKLVAKHIPEYSFKWNRRKKTYGLCSYRTKTIQLSTFLTKSCPEEQVRDTILHEIAHAIAGYEAGHGPKWKAVARQIGAAPKARGPALTKEVVEEMCPTWVMFDPTRNVVVKHYFRKPGKRTFANLHNWFVRGRREETIGKLQLIPYASYKRMV